MFEKTKARIAKFEESHDEARVVVEHVKRYQLVYGCAVTAGVTMLITRQTIKPSEIVINNTPTIAPVMNNIVNNTVNAGGYMRKIIRCIETDEMWSSMSKAAEATGNHLTMMSKHCNGHIEDLQGLHYVIEGLASG